VSHVLTEPELCGSIPSEVQSRELVRLYPGPSHTFRGTCKGPAGAGASQGTFANTQRGSHLSEGRGCREGRHRPLQPPQAPVMDPQIHVTWTSTPEREPLVPSQTHDSGTADHTPCRLWEMWAPVCGPRLPTADGHTVCVFEHRPEPWLSLIFLIFPLQFFLHIFYCFTLLHVLLKAVSNSIFGRRLSISNNKNSILKYQT